MSLCDLHGLNTIQKFPFCFLSNKWHLRPLSQRSNSNDVRRTKTTLIPYGNSECPISLCIRTDWSGHSLFINIIYRIYWFLKRASISLIRQLKCANVIGSSLPVIPVSILYKSIAGLCRPIRVADGSITARYRFIKSATLDIRVFFVCCVSSAYQQAKWCNRPIIWTLTESLSFGKCIIFLAVLVVFSYRQILIGHWCVQTF